MGTQYYADADVPVSLDVEVSDEFQELLKEQSCYFEAFESFRPNPQSPLIINFGGDCSYSRVYAMPDWWQRVAGFASGPFKVSVECECERYVEWYGKDPVALLRARIEDLSAQRDALSAEIEELRAQLP